MTIGAAAVAPSWGDQVYELVSSALISTLIFLIGSGLDPGEMRHGLLAAPFHLSFQLFNLVAMPLLYWAGCWHWHWPEHFGILTTNFAVGTMAAMCLPTTTNTGPLFAQQAGGDTSVAAINAAGGNVLGPFVSPVMASLLLKSAVPQLDVWHSVLKLSRQIVLPLVLGTGAQLAIHAVSAQKANRLRSASLRTASYLLIIVFYFIFCKAFAGSGAGLHAGPIVLMVAFVFIVHVVFLALAYVVSAPLTMGRPADEKPPTDSPSSTQPIQSQLTRCAAMLARGVGGPKPLRRRVTFIIAAPQKTEGLGVAIISNIFASHNEALGELVLPIVAYHTIELVVGSLLLPPLRRLATSDVVLTHSMH